MPAHSLAARIYGSIPALITPFRDEKVDEKALAQLVERQIEGGSRAIAPCGTTGEGVTLSDDEHERVIAVCVEAAGRRVPIIAGAGSNSTARAVEFSRRARKAGADAVLVVAPYYNRPSQDGLVAHYKAINDAVDIPIVAYNVPSRTIVDISVESMGRIAALPNVIAVKDASGDLSRVTRHTALCGGDFIQLSGDDGTAVAFNAQGGKGCISVSANVAPKLCAELQAASLAGDYATARAIDATLAPLNRAMFIEPSPAPAKYACSLLGLCTDDVRLPLLACSDAAKAQVRAAMTQAGLL